MEFATEVFNVTESISTMNYSDVLGVNSNSSISNTTDTNSWIVNFFLQKGSNGSFLQAFLASLAMVVVSELGDKTFFIAAIMAMKNSRLVVFLGALSALVLMTVLSAAFGSLATMIPRVYTYYISAALFAFFGIKMLIEGIRMKPDVAEQELKEVQSDLAARDKEADKDEVEGMLEAAKPKPEEDDDKYGKRKAILKILLQAGTLTFLAEWGDRSQLATVVLAAREHAIGVVIGGCLGHALCTGLAVLGGRLLASKISVRTVTIIGGVLFLIFALSAFIMDPNS